MIVLIRSNSIVGDPRIDKYIQFIHKKGIEYKVIGWDRCNDELCLDNTIFYKKKSGYAIGGINAVYNRILWFFFVLKTLLKLKNVTTVHGCDLDAAFPAALYKCVSNRNVNLIFDVFDWFSATLANQPKWVLLAFKLLEKFTIKQSDKVIICEEERCNQIPYDISNKMLVLPNIPHITDFSFKTIAHEMQFDNDKLTLSYVGGFYGERFLDELLDLASENVINLQIAGYGDKGLVDKCIALSRQKNVHYYGKVPYEKGLQIMYNSDIIYAMYCKANLNHIYAAPNKFYEAMLLSKPIISTCGTLVGEKIEKLHIGYVIEENVNDLRKLVSQITAADIQSLGDNANSHWNIKYKNYVSSFLQDKYFPLING